MANQAPRGQTGRTDRADREGRPWHLIGTIYEAATDPGAWPTALAELSRELDSAAALLVVGDWNSGRCRIEFAHGVPREYAHNGQEYFEFPDSYGRGNGPRPPVGAVLRDDTARRPIDLEGTRIYREVLGPQNLRHLLYAPISRDGGREVALLLGRTDQLGRYTTDEVELFQLIVDEVARAWRLGRSRLNTVLNGVLEVLNGFSVGMALFDAGGQVLAMNQTARVLIADIDAHAAGAKGEETGRRDRTAHLWKLIRDATHATQDGGARGKTPFRALSLDRSRARQPISVLVFPISLLGDAAGNFHEGTVAFLTAPNRPATQYSEEVLRAVYGLTPAEGRLAALVAQGQCVNRIADDLGISVHTARTHLKRAFQKIGVERQVDLALLLSASVGFLRAPE